MPHVVGNLNKLGLGQIQGPTNDSKVMTLDIIQVIFDWEQKASASGDASGSEPAASPAWTTPLHLRESIVSYLLRLASTCTEPHTRTVVLPRALTLLRTLVGPTGWTDVTVKLNFFLRALSQVRKPRLAPR